MKLELQPPVSVPPRAGLLWVDFAGSGRSPGIVHCHLGLLDLQEGVDD